MIDEHNHHDENDEIEDLDETIVLTDENGEDMEFEFLDTIEMDSNTYIVLLPTDDEDAGELVILKVESLDNGEETYVSVDDEAELASVYNEFKEKHADEFDFEDETDEDDD